MNYSTSTLGCLDWDLPTIIERLKTYGYHAIDFRGYRDTFKIWELPEFSTDAAASARRIHEAGLAVSAFSSGVRLVWLTDAERAGFVEEMKRTVEMCRQFAAPQIRIFGGHLKDLSRADGLARGRAFLPELLAITAGSGVQLAVETHDAWTSSVDVLALIEGTDPARVGICWDVKHTYWAGKETPAFTWSQLKDRVINTHWKDTQRDHATGKDRLCLCGDGVIPLADFLDLLLAGGYAGYYTLEWEKKWHPYLANADVAFPQFVKHMGRLRAKDSPKHAPEKLRKIE